MHDKLNFKLKWKLNGYFANKIPKSLTILLLWKSQILFTSIMSNIFSNKIIWITKITLLILILIVNLIIYNILVKYIAPVLSFR